MKKYFVKEIDIGDQVVHIRYGQGKVIDKKYIPSLKQWTYHVKLDDRSLITYAWLFNSEISQMYRKN